MAPHSNSLLPSKSSLPSQGLAHLSSLYSLLLGFLELLSLPGQHGASVPGICAPNNHRSLLSTRTCLSPTQDSPTACVCKPMHFKLPSSREPSGTGRKNLSFSLVHPGSRPVNVHKCDQGWDMPWGSPVPQVTSPCQSPSCPSCAERALLSWGHS